VGLNVLIEFRTAENLRAQITFKESRFLCQEESWS